MITSPRPAPSCPVCPGLPRDASTQRRCPIVPQILKKARSVPLCPTQTSDAPPRPDSRRPAPPRPTPPLTLARDGRTADSYIPARECLLTAAKRPGEATTSELVTGLTTRRCTLRAACPRARQAPRQSFGTMTPIRRCASTHTSLHRARQTTHATPTTTSRSSFTRSFSPRRSWPLTARLRPPSRQRRP